MDEQLQNDPQGTGNMPPQPEEVGPEPESAEEEAASDFVDGELRHEYVEGAPTRTYFPPVYDNPDEKSEGE